MAPLRAASGLLAACPMRTQLLLSTLLLAGCGGGGVKLEFHNGRDGALKQGLNERAPTTFGMKLLAVYLAEDVDPLTQNNIGRTEMIYLNPVCGENIGTCELGPGTNPHDGVAYQAFVTDFFDFAASSAEVNAAIAAQQRAVTPGSYRFTRMEFCKDNPGHVANVRWAVDDGAPREFVYGGCGVTSAPLANPLEVTGQDSVVVTLSYDLAQSVSDMDSTGRVTGFDCNGVSCLTMPTFVPSSRVVTAPTSP